MIRHLRVLLSVVNRLNSPGVKRLLHDDGSTVTLDLHGLGVADAEICLRKTVAEAAARGRSTVRVIHGSSTSDPQGRNRTIKHVLEELIAARALPEVGDSFPGDDVTILGLRLSAVVDRRVIRPIDIR
jgi:hypothetical protein